MQLVAPEFARKVLRCGRVEGRRGGEAGAGAGRSTESCALRAARCALHGLAKPPSGAAAALPPQPLEPAASC